MKKKLLTLLAFVMAAMTAGAFTLTTGTSEHGTLAFKVQGVEVTEASEGDVVTVVCTPSTGYVANLPSGEWSAGIAFARRAPSGVGILEPDFTLTPVDGVENQWTFTMEAANATVSMSYKKLLSNSDITISNIAAQTYTGSALTPTLTVQDVSTVLTLNTDYTVTYSNNVNVGTATATVTAAANSENYAGTATKTFAITAKALEAGFIGTIEAVYYTGQPLTPEPVLTYNDLTLVKGTDYTLAYENNVNAGTATVKATAKQGGNFSGEASKTFTINPKAVQAAWIEDIPDQDWDGTAKTPVLTVKDGEATLVLNKDYTVAYSNNTANSDKGAVATITGKGNYSGTASVNFSIRRYFDNNFTLRPIGTVTYNGVPQEPVVDVRQGKTRLTKDVDYTVSYENNLNAGIATAIVTGIGKFQGELRRNFTVNAYNMNDLTSASLRESLTYTGSPIEPVNSDFTITFTQADNVVHTLKMDEDYYIVEVTDNINCGTATVTIEGMGNFISTRDFSFVVAPKNVADPDVTIANINALTYDGTAKKPALNVMYGGMALVDNVDYTVVYTDSINAGTATATITGMGNYSGTKSKTYTINKANVTLTAPTAITGLVYNEQAQTLLNAGSVSGAGDMSDVKIYYTLTPDNEDSWSETISTGTNAGPYTVYYKVDGGANHNDIAQASVGNSIAQAALTEVTLTSETQEFEYDKTEKTAVVSEVKAGELTVPATSYTVSGNKATNVGTYTVTVTANATSNFTGSVTATFSITEADADERFDITLVENTYVYNATQQTPAITVKDGETVLVENKDYTVAFEQSERINVGTYNLTVTGKGNYTNTKNASYTITAKPLSDSDITINAISDLTYTGDQQTPAPVVKMGSITLAAGTDYDATYTNNVNVGQATVTVTGKGNYQSTKAKTFNIVKADVTVTAPTAFGTELVYNAQAQTLLNPASVNGAGSMTDVQIKYTLTPSDESSWSDNVSQGTDAGSYDVWYKVLGGANHNDVAAAKVTTTIRKAALQSAVLTSTTQTFTYDKTEKTAVVGTVTAEGNLTVPATSYTVSGNKKTKVGTYTVTVAAKADSNFSGSVTATFSITEADANNRFTVTLVENSYVYDGTQKTPTVTVKDGDDVLTLNTDYTFAFDKEERINVATYKVTVTGKGNYQGTKEATFQITKAESSITAAPTANNQTVNLNADGTYVLYDLVNAGTCSGGTIKYSADNGTTWSEAIPQKSDAGTYTVLYMVAGDSNHNDATDDTWTVEVTISKAQATMAFSQANYNRTYGGAAFTNGINVWGKNEIHYVSSEPRVAQVHYFTGAVTIVGAGTATITAKMKDHKNFKPATDISYDVTVAALQVESEDATVGAADAQGVPVITVCVQAGAGSMTPVVDEDYTLDYYTPEEDPYQRTLVTREQMLANPGDYYAVLTFFGNYEGCVEKLITVVNTQVIPGDITGTGEVNADDVEVFIDKLLEGDLPAPSDPDFESYDANGDGKVDIADAQAILNISLGLNWDGSLPNSAGVRAYVPETQLEATYNVSAEMLNESTVRYTVSIEGNFSYTGFQMDARGSVEFIGESGQAVGNMRGNTMKDGTRRVVGYGSVEAYANGTLLCLDVKGEGSVEVFNVVLTTSAAQSVRAVAGTATAITTVTTDNADVQAYDMSGRKVNTTDKKGVYIVNGKKVVRK